MKDIETKREREKKMISQMIALYCHRNHHTKGVLCRARENELMKLKRLFFLILGCVCLALGCVGIVLPVLPTVPFFLATVFCFANSSEKLHTWFLGTELYQKHLDSFVKKKGMTAQTKAGILMSVTLLMAVGFFLMLRKALYIPCTILAIVWL